MLGRSKGVSTLVAAVIILAITLSIGLLASDFFTGTITSVNQKSLNDTQRVSTASDLNLEIVETEHNSVNDSLEVTLRNTAGNISGNIVITSYCKDHVPYQKTVGGLSPGEVERYTISVSNCDVSNVRAELENYPVKVEVGESGIQSVDYLSWTQDFLSDFESANKTTSNIQFLSSSLELDQPQSSKEESAGSFSGTKKNLTTSNGYLQLKSQ